MTQFLPDQPDPALPAQWFVFDGQQCLMQAQQLPTAAPANSGSRQFVGQDGQFNYWSCELIGAAPADWQLMSQRQCMACLPASQVPLLSRAIQLRRFERNHRYCGACASPLAANLHDKGKACPSCGELYYPRLSPAMMLAITRGRQILLARSPHFAPGMYSALAGFVEPGETVESCVEREAFEEVGIRVHKLQYLASQSWPFPHSLMLAFHAEYLSGEITPQAGEIEDAAWFDLDALPAIPAGHSIAHWLITHIKKNYS